MELPKVILLTLQYEDREQFILDNQWAFKYGAQQEFGMRDERIDKEAAKGELELLFVLPEVHSKGIGQAAWSGRS